MSIRDVFKWDDSNQRDDFIIYGENVFLNLITATRDMNLLYMRKRCPQKGPHRQQWEGTFVRNIHMC